MLIALSGAAGSGKSLIAQVLHQNHGYCIASTGEVCRTLSRVLYGSEDRHLLNSISTLLRSHDRELLITAALRGKRSNTLVLDSVRYDSDLIVVRAQGFRVWRIECPIEERFRRLHSRGQTFSEKDEAHPSETELGAARFDATIVNFMRSRQDIEGEIEKLLRHG